MVGGRRPCCLVHLLHGHCSHSFTCQMALSDMAINMVGFRALRLLRPLLAMRFFDGIKAILKGLRTLHRRVSSVLNTVESPLCSTLLPEHAMLVLRPGLSENMASMVEAFKVATLPFRHSGHTCTSITVPISQVLCFFYTIFAISGVQAGLTPTS